MKPTLLIVESDRRPRRVLDVSLRRAGFQVLSAVSGEEALERLAAARPDLIISATRLTDGFDGFALCERLKATPTFATIPFVFLTDERSLADQMRGLRLGVEDYLTKPIFIKEVITRIKLLLRPAPVGSHEISETLTKFSGRLEEMGIVDLIQSVEASGRAGVVRLRGAEGRKAAIYFRAGTVVDAELGPIGGKEAMFRILLWKAGEFTVEFKNVRRKDELELSMHELLIEGMRRADRWSGLSTQLPPLDTALEVDYRELSGRLTDLPGEVRGVLRLFDGRRTIMEAVDDSELSDITTLQIVTKLYGEGLLYRTGRAPTTPPEERVEGPLSGWLGQALDPEETRHSPSVNIAATPPDASAPVELGEPVERADEAAREDLPALDAESVESIVSVETPLIEFAETPLIGSPVVEPSELLASMEEPLSPEPIAIPASQDESSEAAEHPIEDPEVAVLVTGVGEDSPLDPPVAAPEFDGADASVSTEGAAAQADASTEGVVAGEGLSAEGAVVKEISSTEATVGTATAAADEADDEVASNRSSRVALVAVAGALVLLAGTSLVWHRASRSSTASAPPLPIAAVELPSVIEPPEDGSGIELDAVGVAEPAMPPDASGTRAAANAEPIPIGDPVRPSETAVEYERLVSQARVLLRRQHRHRAVALLEQALQLAPDGVDALVVLAKAELELRRLTKASELARRAIASDERCAEAHLVLGAAEAQLGHRAPSREAYRRYLELEPQGQYAREVRHLIGAK